MDTPHPPLMPLFYNKSLFEVLIVVCILYAITEVELVAGYQIVSIYIYVFILTTDSS